MLAGEQLIVVDYEKMLTSLDPTDGTENWQFIDAKGKYIDSPLVTDDLIIAPNGDYSLYALDYEGNLVWTFEAEQALWTRPVTDGTTVYFPQDAPIVLHEYGVSYHRYPTSTAMAKKKSSGATATA